MSYQKYDRNSSSNSNYNPDNKMRSNPKFNNNQDQNNEGSNNGQNNEQRPQYNNRGGGFNNNGQRTSYNNQNNGQRPPYNNRDQSNEQRPQYNNNNRGRNQNNYNNNDRSNNRNNNYQKNPNMQMYQNDDDMNLYQIKKLLIDYINNTVNLSNYKYKLMEYDDDLLLLTDKTSSGSQNYNDIQEKKYFVSPNYMGINGLLVFIKIGDKYLSYIIDKKQLTYNLDKIDYNKINIIPISHRLDDTIYNGTIIDGVFLFDDKTGIKKFVINDLYYFRGVNLIENKITHKMLNVSAYFESIKADTILNDTVFIVNKLYELCEIENLINKYIPSLTYPKAISGIAFYPEFSSQKLIYLFSNCVEKTKPDNNQQNNQQFIRLNNKSNNNSNNNSSNYQIGQSNNQQINEYEIIPENNSGNNDNVKTLTFKVKKTETCDVFNMYLGTVLTNKTFKYVKIGLAYLPTLESSLFCRDAFSQNNENVLLMDCKYDEIKNGWTPIKVVFNKKRPDTMQQLNIFTQKTQQ